MKEKIRISNKEIINAVAGCIYRMHPYHMPEGIDKIMGHLRDTLDRLPDSGGRVDDTFKLFEFDGFGDFKKWLREILEEVPEYHELNVSKARKDKGIKAKDPENSGFRVTSRYDETGLGTRYHDFIDMDALMQNIVCQIDRLQQMEDDCFLCKYAESYGSTKPSNEERCTYCICNPKIRYNRESHPMSLKPRSEWTEEEKELYNLN